MHFAIHVSLKSLLLQDAERERGAPTVRALRVATPLRSLAGPSPLSVSLTARLVAPASVDHSVAVLSPWSAV